MTNKEVYDSLKNRYVRAGSNVCEQLSEIYGCHFPTSRIGFVDGGRLGPRGFELERTNPPDPTLDCSDIVDSSTRLIDLCRVG